MIFLEQLINNLGYDKSKLTQTSYLCNHQGSLLIPLNDVICSVEKKRNEIFNQGLDKKRSESILHGIFSNIPLPPITVHPKNFNNYYELYHGYHRYNISKFLGFTHIPVEIVHPEIIDC